MVECLHQIHSLPFIIRHLLKPTKKCFPLLEKVLKYISLLQKEKYMNSLFDSFERTRSEEHVSNLQNTMIILTSIIIIAHELICQK